MNPGEERSGEDQVNPESPHSAFRELAETDSYPADWQNKTVPVEPVEPFKAWVTECLENPAA